MIRVKICGITNAEDGRVAVEAGADALGFIFVEGTPRYIAPAAAAEIIAGLPPFVTPVGVFWDHAAGHVKAVAEECRLGALQFHGDEPPEALAGFTLPLIKTIKVGGPADLDGLERYRVAAFLLDSPARWSDGERREPILWGLARRGPRRHPLILSPRLTPHNVAPAVALARPRGGGGDSRVEERPGAQSPGKVRRFVAA